MLEGLPKANSTLIYEKLDAQGLSSHLGLRYKSHTCAASEWAPVAREHAVRAASEDTGGRRNIRGGLLLVLRGGRWAAAGTVPLSSASYD